MRKGMEISMIAKATIALVITIVGISMASSFIGNDLDISGKMKDTVRVMLTGSYNDPDPHLEKINESYTSRRVAEMISSCYERTLDSPDDLPCYILQGDFSSVNKNDILIELNNIEPGVGSRTNMTADFAATDMVLIFYDATDSIIDIKS